MKFDVTVIGSGPGGYVAAIRSAQLGFKTALIEKTDSLGGTCLNVGCIPSKALLDSSEHFYQAKKHFAAHGITTGELNYDWETILKRKEKVIQDNVNGIRFLMKKNEVEVIQGTGSLTTEKQILVTRENGETEEIASDKIILATGSTSTDFPKPVIDKKRIISSTEALSLEEVPEKLIVIGGGAIGLEMGSVYSRLGTQVQVIEYMDNLIPLMDQTLGKNLQRVLKKQGLKIQTGLKVESVQNTGSSVQVNTRNKQDKEQTFEADYCLLSIGRRPYSEGLGLDQAGIALTERGFIQVDDNYETSVKGIFAIGDVTGRAMLAHKAEEEGVFVAEHLAGKNPEMNHDLIPSVVYTWPEAAGVGKTEEQLKEENIEFKSGSFNFLASGRARAAGETDGLVKVLADAKTDQILGVHILGARAADLIAEAAIALKYQATAKDIGEACHAHPTYSEAIKEACLAATDNRSIHS